MISKSMKFRKRPIVVDAFQWNGERPLPAPLEEYRDAYDLPVKDKSVINTLEGRLLVSKGDWVIRGVRGEYYSCKPDIFEQTYQKVKNR